MSDGLINPDAIPIPAANTWELESAAAGMKSDGGDISQAGHDIKSTWAGLQSVYSAPESETLFAAVDPVSTKGDDAETALNTAAQALETFAETAQRIRGELFAAQGEARQFLADIEGDEDWNSGEHPFDFESEKGQEHDALLSRVNGLVHEYQEAERTCANAITGTFGGTTFIAGNAEGTVQSGADEMVYGFDEPLENAATPWGTPQGTDHFWTVDAAWAAWDVVRGSVEDVGGAVGAHGEAGWFTGGWGDNFNAYWGDVLAGVGAAAGVWNPETQDWTGSLGEGVQVSMDAGLGVVHGFFPWTELEERPGYAWGTLGTNVAFIVGGVALSMTGAGAVVGVPMSASRLTRIFGGIGGGEGVPGGDEGSSGSDGSEGSGNGGNRPRSEGADPQSPQAPDEDGISADGHYESSRIGGMNDSLSDLENSQNQGPPATPDEDPAPTPTPERSPEPSHRPDAEDSTPSPDRETGPSVPEQRPERDEQRDPTAQEVDEAFTELARNNDDLANDMDAVEDGRAPVFSDNDIWSMSALENSGSNGGRGDDSRVLVASDGAELRADGTFDNSADSPGAGAQDDSDPVTVHEDQRPATGDSHSGGPPEPPRPPGPSGPSLPDPEGNGFTVPFEGSEKCSFMEPGREAGFPTREELDRNMPPNSPDVREQLSEVGVKNNVADDIMNRLAIHDKGVGGQIADIISTGDLNQSGGYSDFLRVFGSNNEQNVRTAGSEIRFAYDLTQRGIPDNLIDFPDKEIKDKSNDVDVQLRAEERSDYYSYQIKQVGGPNAVKNNIQTVGKQLSGELAAGTNKVGIIESSGSASDLDPTTMENIVNNMQRWHDREGVVFRIYFEDVIITFPEGSKIYPWQ